jgi:hypothetical protein
LHAFFGHAVDAAKVAAVGDRNAHVADATAVPVDEAPLPGGVGWHAGQPLGGNESRWAGQVVCKEGHGGARAYSATDL